MSSSLESYVQAGKLVATFVESHQNYNQSLNARILRSVLFDAIGSQTEYLTVLDCTLNRLTPKLLSSTSISPLSQSELLNLTSYLSTAFNQRAIDAALSFVDGLCGVEGSREPVSVASKPKRSVWLEPHIGLALSLATLSLFLAFTYIRLSFQDYSKKSPSSRAHHMLCTVWNPNDTYANIRSSPNGQILSRYVNRSVLEVGETSYDQQGRPWMMVMSEGIQRGYILAAFVRDCVSKSLSD